MKYPQLSLDISQFFSCNQERKEEEKKLPDLSYDLDLMEAETGNGSNRMKIGLFPTRL